MGEATACGACGTANDSGQRFCGDCGLPLVRSCPSCGAENPPTFKFCGMCGASLIVPATAERSLPEEGERRLVSVLFADLSGFTSLSERLDPEEVTTFVDHCMGIMAEVVVRFGGKVARVIGDEMMALFGAPITHEDDAERAVRAALELQACARDRAEEFGHLTLRVGVNTGPMMFGPVGPDREFTVMGDAVNTAKRLQTAAPQSGVLVGEQTYRLTHHAIRYDQIPAIDAKGKSEPVNAWLAKEASATPTPRPVSLSPVVGRDGELELLRRVWERVGSERRPHLVTVIGPPGIGKTRLGREILTFLDASGVRVLRGRSLPYGESTGYGAFAQQLKDLAGIHEDESQAVARGKLDTAIGRVAPGDEELARLLGALAGLEASDAGPDRATLFLAARRFVEALGRERPTVLLFEDVHWADDTLLDLIDMLAARTRESSVLLLALARPELIDRRSGWGGGIGSSVALHLEPLGREHAEALVRELLQDAVDVEILERLIETAGGNPLFLEELVASVTERTPGTLHDLPTSVTGIIAARLDILPQPERKILLDASAVGKVFWRGALVEMNDGAELDAALDALESKDFIRREHGSRIVGDTEYVFKHMLIREVAYQTLPRAVRRERHASAALFIERATGERIAESASLLAHHWREAGDVARAVHFLVMAAERAARAWAKNEAIGLLGQALEIIPPEDTERVLAVRLRRGIEMVMLSEFQAGADELEEITPKLNGRQRVEALIWRARAQFWLFHGQEGAALAQQAVDEAEAIGTDDLVAPALSVLSENSAIEPGALHESIALGEQALERWHPGIYEDLRATGLDELGLMQYWLGNLEQATDATRAGYELSKRLGVFEGVLRGGADLGMALAASGRYEEALVILGEVIALGREMGVPRWVARAINMLGGAKRDVFEVEDARVLHAEAIDLASSVGFAVSEAQGTIDLAYVDLVTGDPSAAEKRFPRIAELSEAAKGFHQWIVSVRFAALQAEAALAQGEFEEAARLAARAREEAREVHRRKYEIRARTTLGRALLALGRDEQAHAEFVAATDVARLFRAPHALWDAAHHRARAAYALGLDEEATAAQREAASAVETFAASLSPERRDRFLARDAIREVLALDR